MPDALSTDELADSVRLSMVSGVGPLLRKALVERFGSPAAVLAASKDELQSAIALLRGRDFGIDLQFTNYR